ncbi:MULTISPECIES: PAS domain-containing protein [Methylorubrum]|jgi:PAS domain S-box-containing protein|uniref:PAS/PAC domain protein n=3 Tax=Methylorubrum TaxID=2282523 RepID=A0A177J768_9HYPH|nr:MULTISPECIES: PAS domain S-box protein [Methylorubrum]ACB79317.1 putative PAS/PAC sensor protein [Methylorubrum populi BJ001]KAB7786615.1 PAS/PAC domain protein [Methylorubrum populi]MBA8913976.1 PAS domain S-box-containing protein [Methylorubrum thiocyanatum]OAH37022.1 histidine kinase [Methylorubrum populi]PZP69670.1 MAG: PAS sensor domain-containing protein [Methylorubrum populi]
MAQSQTFDISGLVAAIGDGVVISDADGRIVTWNPAAERIFGFSEAEALGETLDLITPERHRRRHWDGYAKTMRTGETRYGTSLLKVPALHKDGRALSIAFTVALLHGADGEVTGIAAVIRDETERFQEERSLRRRVAELEEALGTLVCA